MELILTQICLMAISLILAWTVHRVFQLKQLLDVFVRKQRTHQQILDDLSKTAWEANYYPQPEDFNVFDKEFNEVPDNFEDLNNKANESETVIYENYRDFASDGVQGKLS